MGDELRGENLVHLNVRFSTETELKKIQDFLYEKSGQGVSFTGLVEAMANEVTIVTAVHNIKSNKGSRTAGVDKIKMDKYLQMPKDELCYSAHSSTIFSEMLGEDENYQRLKKAKRAAEEALQSVISKEAWNQYLALDEICNELECARYKAMYLAGAADYEKISK